MLNPTAAFRQSNRRQDVAKPTSSECRGTKASQPSPRPEAIAAIEKLPAEPMRRSPGLELGRPALKALSYVKHWDVSMEGQTR